jgi:hypothetical protein
LHDTPDGREQLRETSPAPALRNSKARIELDGFAVVVRDDLW